MSEDARHDAYVAQRTRREAFQAALDAALIPASDAPAEAVRAGWEPMRQFVQEGPHIGETDDADQPDDSPRFN